MSELGLPEVCDVSRSTPSSDGQGGTTQSWSTVATVAARISPERRAPYEREVEGAARLEKRWVITLPALTDVEPEDRLLINTRSFNVVGHDGGRTFEICVRCRCLEVEGS